MSKSQHIDREILKQAIDWYMLQQEQPLSAAQQQQFEQWQKQNPLHLAAWQRTLKLQQRLGSIPAELSKKTLTQSSQQARPILGKLLILCALGGLLSAALYVNQQQAWLADYRTAYGEQKTIQLEDGSRLMLNSKTAIDVRFSDQQRQIVLHYGEVFVQTAKESSPNYRPFRILGRDGVIQALGTQFDVAQDQQQTRVAVVEHAVRISTSHGKQQYLAAGQQLRFDGHSIISSSALHPSNLAWRHGLLVANQIPLQQFAKLIEKNYGVKLEISPALQSMLISGTYPSTNLERLLFSLEQTYAIQTQQHTWGNKVKIYK